METALEVPLLKGIEVMFFDNAGACSVVHGIELHCQFCSCEGEHRCSKGVKDGFFDVFGAAAAACLRSSLANSCGDI